ncbi:MAG: biopolymer transporter ExbD [Pseudomonadota bacterium]
MRKPARRAKAEPTIALINIVFLMLVFFMVAGTLSPPIDGSLKLVNTADLEGRAPAYALVLTEDGTLRYRGAPAAGPDAYFAEHGRDVVRVMPDRAVPATELLRVARELRAAGAERVLIVTEQVPQ